MKVLLDTHIWIWWLTGQPDLPAPERAALDRHAAGAPPLLSAISLWEAQMLHRKGRLQLEVPFAHWLVEASQPDVVQLVPIAADVILKLDALPARLHGDPADRIIVASALACGASLHTHDRAIRRSRTAALWQVPTRAGGTKGD